MADAADRGELDKELRPYAERAARSVLGDGHHSVDECVSQAMDRIWNRREALVMDNPIKLKGLAKVAGRNCAIDHQRKEKRLEPLAPRFDDEAGAVDDFLMSEFDAPQASSLIANRMVLEQAMTALTPDTADMVWMRYRDGMSSAEIAEELGLKPNTVDKRLSMARQILVEVLFDAREDLLGKHRPGTPRPRRGGGPGAAR